MATPQKPGKNNYILVVFDSCRYDSFEAARPKTISEAWQNRAALVLFFVDCSLSLQSAYRAIATLFAGERICIRLLQTELPEILGKTWSRRNRIQIVDSQAILSVVPQGITARAQSQDHPEPRFDSYKLMEHHNDMRAMVKEMTFSAGQSSFYLLNVGETHYPCALSGRDYMKDIDWGRTRAYTFGLAGIYLNLKGRESQGIVDSGAEASALRRELAERSRVEG